MTEHVPTNPGTLTQSLFILLPIKNHKADTVPILKICFPMKKKKKKKDMF